MRILFTAQGNKLDDQIDSRFGRAQGFIVYDQVTELYEWYDNSDNKSAGHGAGTSAAQNVADLGVKAIVTYHVGDKAQKILDAMNIDVYSHVENMTVREALIKFQNNEIDKD